MSWLDEAFDPASESEPVAPPKRVVLTVWIQTRAPFNGDLGGTEAGHYFIEGDVLTMCTEDGTPTGRTHQLAPGDEPRRIAGRLKHIARAKEQGQSGAAFRNHPMQYGPSGVA